MLTFEPLVPAYVANQRLQSIRIHVRDHKMPILPVGERTLEAHYGAFVLSQKRETVGEAKRSALNLSYGRDGKDVLVAGRSGRVYDQGPEVPPDDIDGRAPAVLVWHDNELLFLIASDSLPPHELLKIAISLYGQQPKGRSH